MKYTCYYGKEYFEEYARLVLNDLLNLSLIHREERCGTDKPDLISDDERLGVEVTSAKSEEEGRHNKLFQQIYPHENRTEIIKQEAKRLNIEKDFYIVKGLACFKLDDSRTDRIKILADSINKKLEKLNKDKFNKYLTNALYINSAHYFKEDIEDFLENYDQFIKPTTLIFDVIYIYNVDGLYIFDNKKYSLIKFPEDKLTEYKIKAMEYSKSKIDKK